MRAKRFMPPQYLNAKHDTCFIICATSSRASSTVDPITTLIDSGRTRAVSLPRLSTAAEFIEGRNVVLLLPARILVQVHAHFVAVRRALALLALAVLPGFAEISHFDAALGAAELLPHRAAIHDGKTILGCLLTSLSMRPLGADLKGEDAMCQLSLDADKIMASFTLTPPGPRQLIVSPSWEKMMVV